eukprot:SAG11_NODE_50_length_19992_cov_9.945157_7_plen_77_part_00
MKLHNLLLNSAGEDEDSQGLRALCGLMRSVRAISWAPASVTSARNGGITLASSAAVEAPMRSVWCRRATCIYQLQL